MCHFLGQATGVVLVLAIVSGVFYVGVKIPLFFLGLLRDVFSRRRK